MKKIKNSLLLLTVLVGLSMLAAFINVQDQTKEKRKPNILFIAVDDLRPELGSYGNKIISSPNIDKLAGQGVLFSRAYCNVPVCGASRSSLLTGTRPTDYRFLHFFSRADKDNPTATVLPAHFRSNGYHTVSLSKVFHFSDDSREAWDELWLPTSTNGSPRNYQNPENIAIDTKASAGPPYEMADVPDSAYPDGRTALKACDYLQGFSQSEQPFFLAVGFHKPHLPFNAPKKYWDLYDPKAIGLATNMYRPKDAPDEAFHPWKELRSYATVPQEGNLSDDMALKLRHAYYASVSYIDAQVGLLLAELKKSGLDDNTIVVLWGDHGWNLGENALWGKHCNFNNSMNAPLIIAAPGMSKGKVNQSITEFIDIYPTLCELAGLAPPSHLDGQSLVKRLKKPGKTEDDYAVVKFANGVTYIEKNLFYSEWYDKKDNIISDMLYDHATDPEENVNISLRPENRALVQELRKKLKDKRGSEFFRTD
ncbi:sulfatase [Persicitalea sp.]|uniref:sulfatase n=1 Tax=Persicitalea sp. TaxID=3100273 RepID=UPI0035932C7F